MLKRVVMINHYYYSRVGGSFAVNQRSLDNPKDIALKVHLDKGTAKKLDDCIQALNISRSEVMRRGVHKVHDDLNKK